MITLYNEKNEKLKLISVFEFNDADMGESSISATVSFSEEQDFHPDWHVVYNGEKFYLGVRKPTGKKDTSSLSTTYTLVFKSEREDLKRYTFMDFVELGSGNPQPSSYNVPLYATLSEFVDRFNLNLRHYMGDRWRMVLPQDYTEDGNAISISFDNATLWDALIKVYEIYGVRWVIRSAGNVLQIQVGFQEIEIEHVFEYGKDNGLVSVERNNALERIITRLRGRGSEKNLPPDYFHAGDPDTNSFLQATYFKNLMPKVYRDYVRGYNAGSGSGSWAYNRGVSDKAAGRNIAPIDYALSDKEDLWGISYGAMEPNEKIFPTLQGATRNGVRLDEVLAVEKVLVDGVKEPQNTIAIGIDAAGQESSSGKCGNSPKNNYLEDCRGGIEFTIFTDRFQVTNPINTAQIRITMSPSYIGDDGLPVPVEFGATSTVRSSAELQLVDFANSITGEVVRTQTISDTDSYLWELDDIPSGDYRFKANVVWSANIQRAEYDPTASDVVVNVDTRLTGATVKEYARATDKGEWKETFDIEIRDVWGIARNADESDEDYTYRVWEPRAVSEDMTVMFSDGLLAGEDYEFRIVGFNSDADDLRQTIITAIKPTAEGGWRLTLQKSEAELEASNTYLPNTQQNAKPGDHFFFINISMPYDPYVYDAEARLNAYLEEQLAMKDEEFPSFTITPSKIFCSSFGEFDKIKAGAKIRVRNVALIGDSYISLYIQSLTKRYNANSLNPEWSLTLSDLVVASGNPVEVLEGQVNVLTQRVYSNRSAVQEAVRSLSSTFVRKDGIADVSYSPTEFKKNIKLGEGIADKGFRAGDIQGQGFGVYTDDDGNRVIEADVLVGRIGARFNEVVINQVSYSAGKQVFSAAGMVVSRVEDASTSWRCYFDTKNGTVRNYFTVNDGAFSQRFTDAGIRQYWARVTAIGADYIDISKTDRMQGSFAPVVGDNIAQLGNSTDKSRQAALMIDETHDGGGLVTWYDDITDFTLSNKDSVNIGRVGGKTWLQVYGAGYIGDREQTQYVKYENGVLQIKGRLEVGTKLSDGRDLEQAINEATPEGYEEFVESVTDDIDDIKVSVDGVEKSIEDIQKELDGAIETWFYEGVPTLANAPASDWTTDELKNVHLGDLYYDGVTGKAYRFQMDGSVYVWREITDTDIQAALEAASKAQDTADRKRRVFIEQPTPPYDKGDLWAGGKFEPLRRCIVARSSGSFNTEDWDYADSTQEQIAGYEYLKRALGESTITEGGLIQSSLLMLGYTENGVFNVMSGTNGLYDATKKGGGIAAWYGGPMADIEADNTLVKYAQSLFRFDGSGYLAGGNITWDKDGAGSVAGGDLSWDKDGVITLGSAIKISGDADETLGSILEYVNELRKLWSYDEENKAVHTTLNLIVDGGGAFGMGAESGDVPSASVSIKFEGSTIVYSPVDGIITLPAYPSEGGGVADSVAWSNVTGKPDFAAVATSGQYSDLNGLPTIPTNNNQLTNGAGYITSSALNGYAKLTDIPSSLPASDVYAWAKAATKPSYAFSEITGKPTTLAGYGITDALPLSGGELQGTTDTPLYLNGTDGSYISFRNSAKSILGYFGFDGTQTPKVHIGYNYQYTLIHSGNIGSQSVNYASSAGNANTIGGKYEFEFYYRDRGAISGDQDIATLDTGCYWVYESLGATNPVPSIYSSLVAFGKSYYSPQMSVLHNADRAWLRGVYNTSEGYSASAWHELAFLDSNVASATKLQDNTAFTAWGQTFFENGKPKSVSGDIALGYSALRNSNNHNILSSDGYVVLGFDSSIAGYATYIDGSTVYLRYGTQNTTGLILNNTGNVLIGTTYDAGNRLLVAADNDWTARLTSTKSSVWFAHSDGYGMALESTNNSAGTYLMNIMYGVSSLGYSDGITAFRINDNGNVLIGATSDNGAKLQVNGRSYIGNSNVWNHVIRSGNNSQSAEVYTLKVIQGADCGNGLYDTMIITSSDVATLRISESDGTQMGICAGDGHGTFTSTHDFRFFTGVATNQPVYSGGGGGFKVGINYEGAALYVSGNLTVTGGGAFGSDIRYKDITSYRQLDLETIVNAPLFTFKWTDREDKEQHLGTSAQYWLDTQFKDAVNTANKDFYHLDYGALAVGIGISVAREVKEVKTEVELLRDEVRQLKEKLNKYEQVWHN